jgi:Uma2 family endonuclease
MTARDKLYTLQDFETFIALPENRDRHFELIHGEIIEKAMPTEEHGLIVTRLVIEIGIYLKQHPIGRLGVEIQQHPAEDDSNVRQPDITFSLNTTRPVVKKGFVPELADLIVEVKSPNDTYAGMRAKAAYYIEHGAKLVWLVYPEKELVEVYRPHADIEILTGKDTLSGDEVLPNFTLIIQDIFAV